MKITLEASGEDLDVLRRYLPDGLAQDYVTAEQIVAYCAAQLTQRKSQVSGVNEVRLFPPRDGFSLVLDLCPPGTRPGPVDRVFVNGKSR